MSMTPRQFMEEVYEIAYGDQAYYRGFFPEEVLETLREFSDNALKVEELSLEPEQYEDCLLYTSPSPRDAIPSRMPSSA